MRVGFTGTQSSITQMQLRTLWDLLNSLNPEWCHHGDCLGADQHFHETARSQGRLVVIHPPNDPKKRAYCQGNELRLEKPYLDRKAS